MKQLERKVPGKEDERRSKVAPAENSTRLTEKNIMALNDDNVLFKDFTEPDLLKTGYLIPL